MSGFIVVASALVLLAAGFAAWPLRRQKSLSNTGDERRAGNVEAWRNEVDELERQRIAARIGADEYARARRELDRRVLAEAGEGDAAVAWREGGTRALLIVVLTLPVLAFVLYAALGAYREVGLDAELHELGNVQDPALRSERMVALVPRLEAVAAHRDPQGNYRFLLARSYMTLGRHAEAAVQYAALSALYPEDAALIAQQAQALYLAGGRVLTPAVQALIDRAFAVDPAQVTLLGMVGMDRFQAGDFAGAVQAWEKLLAQLPADAPDAAVIRDGIAMARTRLGGEAGATHPHAGEVPATTPAAGVETPSLQVEVSLAEGLDAPADAVVFVFARAVDGPPMPLAVARFAVAELPRGVTLDDSMAMAPGLRLSQFPEVRVTARVSRAGSVEARPGDLEGSSPAVAVQRPLQELQIVIDRAI